MIVVVVVVVLDRDEGDDYSRYHDKVFRVVDVLDGDTFDIDLPDGEHTTTRIRLWGVDTPEVAGADQGEMYFGPEASAFAKKTLLGQHVRVELSPTKTRGVYERLLAYVYVEPDGVCFNELLVETGHAYADWRFPHVRKARYKTIEGRAQRQGIGLWANVTPEQYPPWRQQMESWLEERRGEKMGSP
jgi:micrococcal nuclease